MFTEAEFIKVLQPPAVWAWVTFIPATVSQDIRPEDQEQLFFILLISLLIS